MKDNVLIGKIISFVLGMIIGGILVYSYSYFIPGSSNNSSFGGNPGTPPNGNMDVSSMSDSQLEKMAERAGITKDELKSKLKSGESLRDIMPNRSGSGSVKLQNTSTGSN
ncbi:MAG: hypothetical protein PHN31_02420 [Candidatus Gracilibacteria bacterium]|nr:hypothetical protein [Candidatus Gracilibacteria bacterium]